MRQVVLFCVGGFIGFLVDAGLVQFLVSAFDANRYASRLLSFLAAATATWLFNRRFTFRGVRHYGRFGEWSRYVLAMCGGFAVNFSIYSWLVYHYALVHRLPALGVAIGSLGGFAVNFSASRFWIYRHRAD
ncbi:GtrA family protein [Dokdonella immobilis]|uniref:Putative flippase GtrA (Transmembrane translocase of bactoprenol-linked glucose) n=1 Tax=Dokdonella immobilis TaxID=578942 RepID=A0A1I5AG56_9GAMM|nr:GtrA family protein [Dokdonella immobilis]SFN61423.1 Putative flippase GtrA (transmembrane translocase of bactoprenol-linked glucose) [Dokdonella immobilis]